MWRERSYMKPEEGTDHHNAKKLYLKNDLEYHNWLHVQSCYRYLYENNVPYDADLDTAVAYHDAVYDEHQDKEHRSSLLVDNKHVREIIMSTKTHNIIGADWQSIEMIKADLHQLAVPELVLINFYLIMKESKALYKITTRQFLRANRNFMETLSQIVLSNYSVDNVDFWLKVNRGIESTITIGKEMESFLDHNENLPENGCSHTWEYCDHCDRDVVLCGNCGNNTCNGGHGTVDGEPCQYCESAYELYMGKKNESS